MHQGQVRKQASKSGSPECPDFLIVKYVDFFHSTPILVSDFKTSRFGVAGNKTVCYSIDVADVHHDQANTFPVLLALPVTLSSAVLEKHVTVHKKVWRIPVASATLTDKALLSTLCAAVQYMCTHPPTAHIPALTAACPYKEWSFNDYEPLTGSGYTCQV